MFTSGFTGQGRSARRQRLITSCCAAGLVLAGVAVALPGGASAAPKSGCPASSSGWSEASINAVADTIWVGLLDPSPWNGVDELAAEIAAQDRNGDGDLCLVVRWGDRLSPKSHWYQVGIDVLGEPASYFLVTDNQANAADG